MRDGDPYARLASTDGDESHEDFVRIEAQRPRRLKHKDGAGEGVLEAIEDWDRSVLTASVCYRD